MLVLALDASLGPVSAAVVDTVAGGAFVRRDEGGETGRAERLPKLVADLLAAAAVQPSQIDRIAVTTGPGGFTGVRVGVAFARGFALVHGTPVVGIDTLTALAISVTHAASTPVLAAVHGRTGRVVSRCFAPGGTSLGPTAEMAVADLRAAIPPGAVLAGPAAAAFATPDHPLAAATVSVEALARIAAGLDPAAAPPDAHYAAPPDAIRPTPSGLLADVPVSSARPDMPPRPVRPVAAGGEQ
jgi:tRNA threonylcarbamoyladenosine biosynthesis protein TsaB